MLKKLNLDGLDYEGHNVYCIARKVYQESFHLFCHLFSLAIFSPVYIYRSYGDLYLVGRNLSNVMVSGLLSSKCTCTCYLHAVMISMYM